MALSSGTLPPHVPVPPPGPRSRAHWRELAATEAPGVNTLVAGRGTVVWAEALGANVLDVDGNLYVDLTAGFSVAAVGHRHPRVVAAATTQAGRLLHGLGDVAAHPPRIELARRLGRLAPVDEPRVHFAISGADAVEIALKSALLATGRPGVVAFDPSYHGVTLGALAATSRPAFRAPFRAHLHSHLHRLPYGAEPWRLDRLIRRARPGTVLLEPVVGREGVIPPPDGWLREVARLCREHDVLLVADEVFTGFGRTGHLFAVDREQVRPDLLCCGKALAGGLPIAATIGRREVMEPWDAGGEALHTATFLAHPPACAAALAVLDLLEEEDLPGRARRLGEEVAARLAPWPGRYRTVREVRGRGLLWGVELSDAATAKQVTRGLLERGVLALAGGPRGNVVELTPPLTITEEQLTTALDLLERTLPDVPPAR
jgi:4-aminobutyrate aminotransferase-like enzyme